MRIRLLSLSVLGLLLASCSTPVTKQEAVLADYQSDSTVRQLLYVEQTDSSSAMASFYVKEGGEWLLLQQGEAYIGKAGLGKEKEGDMKTPIGEYGIGQAFGILANPGTTIPYIEVTDSWYGCDDEAYYNQLIDTAEVHHECHGEHLIAYDPEYRYALTTTYNQECVPGLGSCIFIHCKGKRPYTAGCVALDEDMMRLILQRSDTGLVVSIHPKD